MFAIENQFIGLEQTFNGKRVADMSPSEIIAMERTLLQKADIKKFSYRQGGSGEVYVNASVTGGNNNEQYSEQPQKPQSNFSINIGGKYYNSWDEVMADTTNPHIINRMTIDGSGNKIVERQNRVYINGELVCDKSQQQVVIVVHGNVSKVDTQTADVRVYGDCGSVETQSGNIEAETISGDADTMSGSIHAKTIKGDASTMSGNVYKN